MIAYPICDVVFTRMMENGKVARSLQARSPRFAAHEKFARFGNFGPYCLVETIAGFSPMNLVSCLLHHAFGFAFPQ